MTDSAVIILSGGLDSTVLAHKLKHEGFLLRSITFDYGQKHAQKEILCARFQSEQLSIEHNIVDLKGLIPLFGNSSLVDPASPIPSGHYTDQSMKATVVPNRNMILVSVAAALAISAEYNYVAYGAHAGDHTIYPDCRPEFADALTKALELADWHKVSLLRPFVSLAKQTICKIGHDLGVDFLQTWSCYCGADLHCGRCGTCVERKEAFALAGLSDPTPYQLTE